MGGHNSDWAPGNLIQPADLCDALHFIEEHRGDLNDFDVAIIGWTTGRNRNEMQRRFLSNVNAGATWWLECLYTLRDSSERMCARIRLGPPD